MSAFRTAARLERCPLHPRGGCGFTRHGTYQRKSPAGTHIARWYCRLGHQTFSLLPDHLAARFPGTLVEIERVVAAAERTSSVQACADALRPVTVSLPSAMRWVRRRMAPVHALLPIVVAMVPQHLQGCAATIQAFHERLVAAPAAGSATPSAGGVGAGFGLGAAARSARRSPGRPGLSHRIPPPQPRRR